MNTFNKKSLYVAVAGLSAVGAAGVAQAVSVNGNGLGQVLIYPYYTVRDQVAGAPYNSLLSVVNSTSSAKAVKVRFLEGKNSREVLDFNLYLSARDVWTAAIIPTTEGAGIFTTDKSCTTPTVSSSAASPTPFVNFQYVAGNADGADTSLDRTREGYVEIIEMGNLTGTTASGVTHSSGVPAACPSASSLQPSADTVPGDGGLFGGISLINVVSGIDVSSNATALEGFSQTSLWATPSSIDPTLAQVNPKTSVVTTGTSTYITDWSLSGNGADPVSAVLMHDRAYNEFVLDKATLSGTDWVITLPTKRYYYSGTAVTKLFQRNFSASGACDDVTLVQWDREERGITSTTSFSPPPPTQTDSLCWEANVTTLNNSNVLGSKNSYNIPSPFENGWIQLGWADPTLPSFHHRLVGGPSTTFNTNTGTTGQFASSTTFAGLPAIGFQVQRFVNGTLRGPCIDNPTASCLVQSNYAGTFPHRFRTTVTGQ
jgi:hypothetical protein